MDLGAGHPPDNSFEAAVANFKVCIVFRTYEIFGAYESHVAFPRGSKLSLMFFAFAWVLFAFRAMLCFCLTARTP